MNGPSADRAGGYAAAAMADQQLWLLRHGEAVPHESKDDFERELTARGERQSIAAGQALARLGVEFAACYSSPLVRAVGHRAARLPRAQRRAGRARRASARDSTSMWRASCSRRTTTASGSSSSATTPPSSRSSPT